MQKTLSLTGSMTSTLKGGIMNNNKCFDIQCGPSRETLFDACKYAYDESKINIHFDIALKYTEDNLKYYKMQISDVKVIGVEHEDGSGTKLNIHGTMKADLTESRPVSARPVCYKYIAYYDTKKKKGTILFVS